MILFSYTFELLHYFNILINILKVILDLFFIQIDVYKQQRNTDLRVYYIFVVDMIQCTQLLSHLILKNYYDLQYIQRI
jgi:hypothetical protein